MTRSDFFKIALAFIAAPVITKLVPDQSKFDLIRDVSIPIKHEFPYKHYGIFIPEGNVKYRSYKIDGTDGGGFQLRWKDNQRFNEVELVKS